MICCSINNTNEINIISLYFVCYIVFLLSLVEVEMLKYHLKSMFIGHIANYLSFLII